MDKRQRSFRIWRWCAVLLAACAISRVAPLLIAHAADGGFKTYLPLITDGQRSAPPSSGGDGAASWWLPYSGQDGAMFGTTQPNIAIDARGGMHITYSTFRGSDGGARPAYYMECAAACGDQSHWSRVRLSANVVDVRLLLDQAGHPRLMIFADNSRTIGDELQLYQYAACDSECGDKTNWTITTVGSTMVFDIYRQDYTNHFFALDAQGHPGFVYVDVDEHDGHGVNLPHFCGSPAGCVKRSRFNTMKRIGQRQCQS